MVNKFVGYITRSYAQIKQDVLNKFPTDVPELTDHTENNIFVRLVSVWAGITEHLGYYLDRAARETFLSTQTQYNSAVKFASMFDYRIRGVVPASVDIEFTLSAAAPSNILIPIGTICTTGDGVVFTTIENKTILAGQTTILVKAEQKTKVSNVNLGTSDGTKFQKFPIDLGVVDNSVECYVNAILWNNESTLAFSLPNDNSYVQSVGNDQKMTVIFGDNVNGSIPPNGDSIDVDYFTSLGTAGNLPENTVIILQSVISLPSGFSLSVTNPQRSSGGSDLQSLSDLKRLIPYSIRTLNRAVTEQDYKDLAMLVPGVAKSGVSFQCGQVVKLYIAPVGGGLASNTLLTNVVNYFSDKDIVGKDIQAASAGEVKLILNINLKVKPNYNKVTTETEVRNSLLSFLSVTDQEINGELHIGDIYERIEEHPGTDWSEITLISFIPYAEPINHNNILNWTPVINSNSVQTIEWKINLVTLTTFELFKDNIYMGTFSIGSLITMAEIQFTVNPSGLYVAGNQWKFKTYPYNDSIVLNEPSLIVLYNANLNITTTGGF